MKEERERNRASSSISKAAIRQRLDDENGELDNAKANHLRHSFYLSQLFARQTVNGRQ
jgi:hypothetical protein